MRNKKQLARFAGAAHRIDGASAFGTAAQQKRPNILVILMDNLGYGEPGMYAPPQKLPLPKVINLLTDRKEERDVGAYNPWSPIPP